MIRTLLFYMSTVCIMLLVPMTMIMEPTALAVTAGMIETKPGFIWWLIGNSALAFFVNLTKCASHGPVSLGFWIPSRVLISSLVNTQLPRHQVHEPPDAASAWERKGGAGSHHLGLCLPKSCDSNRQDDCSGSSHWIIAMSCDPLSTVSSD